MEISEGIIPVINYKFNITGLSQEHKKHKWLIEHKRFIQDFNSKREQKEQKTFSDEVLLEMFQDCSEFEILAICRKEKSVGIKTRITL